MKIMQGQRTVAHNCNPIYLGGEDWEDGDLRTAQTKN
jgi:hypothetical protein